jgi:hypothetical protein
VREILNIFKNPDSNQGDYPRDEGWPPSTDTPTGRVSRKTMQKEQSHKMQNRHFCHFRVSLDSQNSAKGLCHGVSRAAIILTFGEEK